VRERPQRKGAEAVGVDPGGAYIRRIGDIIPRTRSSRILIDESRAPLIRGSVVNHGGQLCLHPAASFIANAKRPRRVESTEPLMAGRFV
jgi:hypothetical protein